MSSIHPIPCRACRRTGCRRTICHRSICRRTIRHRTIRHRTICRRTMVRGPLCSHPALRVAEKNLNENTATGAMVAVALEVVLSGAGFQDKRRQGRRLGDGHRGARQRHAAGPVVPLQDHRAPSTQPLQVLHMSGTPLFSTHTTYTDRPPRRSGLRRALRHRALPTRRITADRLAATDDKKVKALPLGSI